MVKYATHPLIIVLATIIVMVFSFSNQKTIEKHQNASEAITQLEQENINLSKGIANLQEDLIYSESDFSREKVIRNELLMQKPGEYIIQLPPNPDPPPSPSPTPQPRPIDEWKKLLLRK